MTYPIASGPMTGRWRRYSLAVEHGCNLPGLIYKCLNANRLSSRHRWLFSQALSILWVVVNSPIVRGFLNAFLIHLS
jgi:hypothetical protein